MRKGTIRIDLYKHDNLMLEMQCDNRGIECLVQIMQELAHGRIRRFELHSQEFVEMQFDGEVSLEVIKARRFADNVDVDVVCERGVRRINWRASCDEWDDNVERVQGLADSEILASQYLALESCAVGVKVSHNPSLDREADVTAEAD